MNPVRDIMWNGKGGQCPWNVHHETQEGIAPLFWARVRSQFNRFVYDILRGAVEVSINEKK